MVISNTFKIAWGHYYSTTGVVRTGHTSSTITWIYPISFVSNPIVHAICDNSFFLINYGTDNSTQTSFTVRNMSTDTETAHWFKYLAVGY